MKKGTKIALWVCGGVVALLITAFMCADIIVSYIVHREVAEALKKIPDTQASVGKIYLNLISGSAVVKDISFSTHNLSVEDTISGPHEPGLALKVSALRVWNIRYWELFREHRLVILNISIDNPRLLVYLDEEHPESLLPNLPKDTTLEKAHQWLQSVSVGSFDLDDFCARLQSTHSPLCVTVDSLDLETDDLAYRTEDSTFFYNDSVYEVYLSTLKVRTPDGQLAIETHDLQTRNQGAVKLGYTRLRNLLSPKQLADKAKEPTTWIDLELNSLSTSPLNPIRKALAKDTNLDSLHVDVKRMHVCRDERYKPKTPFGTPQDYLRQVPVTFCVKHVDALARKVDIEMATTDINCGKLHVRDIHALLSNVTNRPGATWYNRVRAPFGKAGKVEASYAMHLDKASTFEVKLDAWQVETEEVNGFIRPLIGITSECHIDHLNTHYKGDRNIAKGDFCMEYHGLKVKVHKEDKVPYEIITKHADMFTELANSLVPHSNPTSVDPAPRRYEAEWKRDEWKPYPLYIFGPVIDGIKKTMLPGLYVHKQVRGKKK